MNTRILSVLAATAVLTACATTPEPRPVAAVPAEPVNLTKVYFYPTQGQSEDQQDRDRYECYVWAVKQTGFDPSLRIAPRDARATVVPARSPESRVGAAAVVGAMVGAVAAGPGNAGEGAVVGAIAGTALGAAAASADAQQAQAMQARRGSRALVRYEQEAGEYRRAMSACLEGRGYSVK